MESTLLRNHDLALALVRLWKAHDAGHELKDTPESQKKEPAKYRPNPDAKYKLYITNPAGNQQKIASIIPQLRQEFKTVGISLHEADSVTNNAIVLVPYIVFAFGLPQLHDSIRDQVKPFKEMNCTVVLFGLKPASFGYESALETFKVKDKLDQFNEFDNYFDIWYTPNTKDVLSDAFKEQNLVVLNKIMSLLATMKK
jgi:hypothetical protein